MSDHFKKLPALFFATRQLMRSKVRTKGRVDPNNWMRLETLRFIAENERSTMQDVARYLRVTAPSATSLVQGLVRRKLVTPVRDRKDRRITRLGLSAGGKKALHRYLASSATLMREIFARMHTRDVREIVRILEQLDGHHRYD